MIEIRGLFQEIGTVSGDVGIAERRKVFQISYGCGSLFIVRRIDLFVCLFVTGGKTALGN